YQTALLAALAEQVFTIERMRPLAEGAQAALRAAGVTNVSVLVGDGTLGWSAYAPYHAILVAAGGPEIPPPLVEQLAPGGRMIIPLGAKGAQTLTLVRRTAEGIRTAPIGEARFSHWVAGTASVPEPVNQWALQPPAQLRLPRLLGLH